MKGSTLPRLYTPPLLGRREDAGIRPSCPCRCGLSPVTSRGFEVIGWVKRIGFRLHPWQRWLLIHALELDATCTRFRFRTVLVLVARQNGKTLVKMLLSLWRMYECNDRLLVGTAQDRAQAKEVMNEGLVRLMRDNPKLRARFDPDADDPVARVGIWHKTLGEEHFCLDSEFGPRYLIKALNRRAGRGLWDVREINIDELREQTDFEGWGAISKLAMASGPWSQIWCTSNAGDRTSLLLNHLRGIALGGEVSTEIDDPLASGDEALFHAEWSAAEDEGYERDSPEWAQANPSLGYPGGPTIEAIRSSFKTDPPAVFRTEVLCQFVDAMNAAVDIAAWRTCGDPSASVDERPVICVEAAPEGHHITAVAASRLGDGRLVIERVGAWSDTIEARAGIRELVGVWRPRALGWFPSGPGAVLSSVMRGLGAREIKGMAVAEACMTLAELVKHRRILHPNDALLDEHLTRTNRIGPKPSWSFDRSSIEPIDGAYAVAGAVHLVLNQKAKRVHRRIIVPTGGGV
jgi:hypothetical protein